VEGRIDKMKLVYIKESKVDVLRESEEELTFWRFFVEVKKFITELLTDPIHARPSVVLVSHGLDNDTLRKKLQDEAVIVKSENIDEPHDEITGKIESRYYLSYKVPKKDFKKKLRRLYQKYVESKVNESFHTPNGLMLHDNELGNNINMRGQIDQMLNSPLTMGVACDERAPQYVKDAVKIYNDKIINKKLNKNGKET
jgi:hypothetical protein